MNSISIQMSMDQNKLGMDGRLRFMDRLFKYTCLIFRNIHQKDSPIRRPRLFLAILMFLIVGYQACYSLYYTVRYGQEKLAASLMMVCWLLQTTCSILFIIYWQLNGHFMQIFEVLAPKQQEKLPKSLFARKRLRILYIFSFIFMILIALVFVVTFYMYYWGDVHVLNVERTFLEGFGGEGTGIISALVGTYAIYVWFVVLAFYIVVSSRIQQELEQFNEDLKQIGEKNSNVINQELLINYEKQVDLTDSLRIINGTFEAYAFIMIATNIPTTIFTLINTIQRLKRTTFAALIHFPEMSFCLLELIGLTVPPARIHSLVHAVEGILFANKKIWIPHSDQTYQIAGILISHSQQNDLGLSLWGYVLITKGLILSTVSLVLTYLTLIIEMGSNEIMPQIFNATAI